MKLVLLALLSLLGISAAEAATTVIYFGGYGASQEQMKCWEDGARKDPRYAGYDFKAFPYPIGATGAKASVLAAGENTIQRVLKRIGEMSARDPKRKFIIAGHSSGAALANAVAERVKNPSQVELVDLDGFAASPLLQKRIKTTCVYAENPNTGLRSRNAGSMTTNCPKENQKRYPAAQCKTAWCLHFAVVNTKAPPYLGSDFKQNGYKGCGTNLDKWLAASPANREQPETTFQGTAPAR